MKFIGSRTILATSDVKEVEHLKRIVDLNQIEGHLVMSKLTPPVELSQNLYDHKLIGSETSLRFDSNVELISLTKSLSLESDIIDKTERIG